MRSIFDEEFYPTPTEVIDQMMNGEPVIGRHILEPSAGSGNIVDWLYSHGAERTAGIYTSMQRRQGGQPRKKGPLPLTQNPLPKISVA